MHLAGYGLFRRQLHPTDAVNAILADNVRNGRHVDMCYRSNLETMLDAWKVERTTNAHKNILQMSLHNVVKI